MKIIGTTCLENIKLHYWKNEGKLYNNGGRVRSWLKRIKRPIKEIERQFDWLDLAEGNVLF